MPNKIQNETATITNEEYSRLFSGSSSMRTYDLSSKGIRPLLLSDGPIGIRMEDANGDSLAGISKTLPSTCFPAASTLASSFDKDLLERVGKAIGEEARHYGADIILGPAINIMRNPLGGRNFEYYSEDPFLTGYLASNYVKGLQSTGTGSCLKHFAANNNETNRFVGDSIVDDRTLHDIYLKPFEMVVKNARPLAVMSSYNRLNGTFCSENEYLLNKTLRKEWGFDGVVMTDWGGCVSRVKGILNGCDLEMPGMCEHNVKEAKRALDDGTIPQNIASQSALRIKKVGELTEKGKFGESHFDEHYELALEAALESAVLLKNDGILPLDENSDFCVIGSLFMTPRYQGSGSSMLNPSRFVSHKGAFASNDIKCEYEEGYDQFSFEIDLKKEKKALDLALKHQIVLFYGGLTDFMESEGFDRDSMKLPANQVSLLNKLIAEKKRIIFLYFGGNAVEMPFLDGVSALLNMGLPGEAIGEATRKIVFGYCSPSGRLTYTWPKSYLDVPFGNEFAKKKNEAYKESIYVGYRYYVSAKKAVLFPFGYGLSYTSFTYGKMKIEKKDGSICVKVDVTNNGSSFGYEIVQAYIGLSVESFPTPKRELKGIARISLTPGETKEATIQIPFADLLYFDERKKKEIFAKGQYLIEICRDSMTPIDKCEMELGEEDIKVPYSQEILKKMLNPIDLPSLSDKEFIDLLGYSFKEDEHKEKPYDMETAIRDFDTPFGRFFKWVTSYVGLRQYRKGRRLKDSAKRERECKAGWFVYRLMGNNSLRSLCFSSGGAFKYNIAEGILQMVNGHFIKGLKAMLKKER